MAVSVWRGTVYPPLKINRNRKNGREVSTAEASDINRK